MVGCVIVSRHLDWCCKKQQMQGSGSCSNKGAHLAFRGSFESLIEESSEMKEFWSNETNLTAKEDPNTAFQSQDFSEMARKQQNYKMYKVMKS